MRPIGAEHAATGILAEPWIQFGRETCGDLAAALRREWLVTNGLGGYASGTLAGINTRRYHGLLIAALPAPLGRLVMLSQVHEQLHFPDGTDVPLSGEGWTETGAER